METPTHTAPPVALDRLVLWRNARIAEARERGDEFFMGLPDAWYEPPTWACINGHVSTRYLKSELRGDICIACQTPLWLIPRITEAELAEILSENEGRSGAKKKGEIKTKEGNYCALCYHHEKECECESPPASESSALQEALQIARTAMEAVEAIYGHAQFCDNCQSFEIAKQCRDELHGMNRIMELENASCSATRSTGSDNKF